MPKLLRCLLAGMLCGTIVHFAMRAYGRDDGRYANSPLKSWFDSLQSGQGSCCSFADGVKIDDVDYDTQDGKYRVRLCAVPPAQDTPEGWASCDKKEWFIVPDNALITQPNKFGPAVVWPFGQIHYKDDGDVNTGYTKETKIRCFMPGAGT